MPQTWLTRGGLRGIGGWSLVSNLPRRIAERSRSAILEALNHNNLTAAIECVELSAPGPGTCAVLVAEFESTRAGFSALGEKNKPAEQVGQEAAQSLLAFVQTEAAIEEHLADQMVVFLALASGRCQFTTSKVTRHLLTNLWTVQQCLPVRTRVEGHEGEPGLVTIEPTP